MYESDMLTAVVPNSAKALNFQKEFSLTDKDVRFICFQGLSLSDHQNWLNVLILKRYPVKIFIMRLSLLSKALRISDHYPVEVELKTKPEPKTKAKTPNKGTKYSLTLDCGWLIKKYKKYPPNTCQHKVTFSVL